MFGVDLTGNSGGKAEEWFGQLSGGGTANLRRLKELFKEESDPSPTEIYKAYHGIEEFDTAAEKEGKVSVAPSRDRFDPKEDNPSSSDLISVQRGYEKAKEQGLDDEAELLRELTPDQQKRFASFLKRL